MFDPHVMEYSLQINRESKSLYHTLLSTCDTKYRLIQPSANSFQDNSIHNFLDPDAMLDARLMPRNEKGVLSIFYI